MRRRCFHVSAKDNKCYDKCLSSGSLYPQGYLKVVDVCGCGRSAIGHAGIHRRLLNIPALSRQQVSCQDQAVGGGAGDVGGEADGGLVDVEGAGEGSVEVGVECLLNLLVIAVEREAQEADLQVGFGDMHDQVAVGSAGEHGGDGSADVETVPVDVRGDKQIAALHTHADILCGKAAADLDGAKAAAQLSQRGGGQFNIRVGRVHV